MNAEECRLKEEIKNISKMKYDLFAPQNDTQSYAQTSRHYIRLTQMWLREISRAGKIELLSNITNNSK